MQPSFHSASSLANAPSDSCVCHLADSKFLSVFSPLSAIKWLFTDLNIDGYKSFSNFFSEKAWDKGVTKINVPLLRLLGLNKARCDALEFGFDLGFVKAPPVQEQIPSNYSSIASYGDIIQNKLMNDVSVGTLEVFNVQEALAQRKQLLFHPLGAVPKGDSDCRIIVDTSATGLNDCLMSPELAFPSVKSLLNGTRPNGFGCSFDLSSYFHQLKVRDDQTNFLCISFPDGTTARYRSICFGLRPAPFLAQGTTVDIRDLAIRWNVLQGASMVFVDDFSNTHDDGSILATVRLLFIAFMAMLGFLLHPDKQPFPSQCFKVLGYEIDTVNLTISIAGDKQAKRLKLVADIFKELRANGYITLNQAQSLVGKLTHSAFIVLTGRFHILPWWRAIAQSEKEYRVKHKLDVSSICPKQTRIQSSQSLIDSLLWWQRALSDPSKTLRSLIVKHDGFLDVFDEESLHGSPFHDSASIMDASIMSRHNGIAVDFTIDASTMAFACSYTTSTGISDRFSEMFPPDLWHSEQIQLEIESVIRSISIIINRIDSSSTSSTPSPKFMLLKTDCLALIHLVNQWSCKSDAIIPCLDRLASLCFDHNCQIVATLVSRTVTSEVHALASPQRIRFLTPPKCNHFVNAITTTYEENSFSHRNALVLHRDSIKHLIENRISNKFRFILFSPYIKHSKLEELEKDFRVDIVLYRHHYKVNYHGKFKCFVFNLAKITSKS